MENWEKEYLHNKAVLDSQYTSTGKEIPKGIPYGRLKIDKYLWMQFNGKEFWKELNKRGHTTMDFKTCNCYNK